MVRYSLSQQWFNSSGLFHGIKASVCISQKKSQKKITRLNEATKAYLVSLLMNGMLGSCWDQRDVINKSPVP